MNLTRIKLRLKKIIVRNDVKALAEYLMVKEYRDCLRMNLSDINYLQEVRSLEMLSFLLSSGIDIRLKNSENKSPKQVMKKRFKALKKEKKCLQISNPTSKKIRQLKQLIQSQAKAIRILNLVNKNIYFVKEKNISNVLDSSLVCNWLLKLRCNAFLGKLDKATQFSEKLIADLLTIECEKTIFQSNQLDMLLKKGGYSKKKQNFLKHILTGNKSANELYLKDEMGNLALIYRGTTNQNDAFEPLCHFGTLKAAKERLQALAEAIESPNTRFYQKAQKGAWVLNFQIKPVYLKMKKPFRLPEMGEHNLSGYKKMFIPVLLRQAYGAVFINYLYAKNKDKFTEKLSRTTLPKEYDFVFEQPLSLSANQVKKELLLGSLYPVISEKDDPDAEQKNKENLMFQRLIRYFERKGYDGFVYRNGWEDVGSDSFITFRKEQVVLATEKDKKKIISPVKILNEKELMKLEEMYLKKCMARCLSFEEAKEAYSEAVMGVFGVQLVPQKVLSMFKNISQFVCMKMLQNKLYEKE